ncbi:unnamed protein product [Calicophoron daubneyi]|uniref:Uncharacterized protein n=1 Tax=Calicophoron daubneyi TaxID=300641 RepID=A0AAV2TNH6_CALDB
MNKMMRAPPKPPQQEAEMFDLLAQIKIWAINTYVKTATREQKKVDMNDLDLRVCWDDVTVIHEPPEYFEDKIRQLPKSHSLFSTTFRNNTDSDHEYSFRTERCTRSVAEIQIERGVVTSKDVSLKLALPNALLEANAGFHQELSLSSATRQSKEEELSWGVDTRITVPGRKSAFAEIKIDEQEMTCRFRLITKMYGRIRAVFLDAARNQAFIKYIEGDLGSIIEETLQSRRPPTNSEQQRPQVWVEDNKCGNRILYMETMGRCSFRFGVHQSVEVSETDL